MNSGDFELAFATGCLMQMVVSPSKYGNCYILVASEYFTGCPIHYTFEIAYYAFKKFNVPKFSLLAICSNYAQLYPNNIVLI